LIEDWEKWLTLTVIALLIVNMVREWIRPSLSFVLGAVLLVLSGVIEMNDLLHGFSNKSILTIFVLILITATLRDHFNVIGQLDKLFRRAKSPRGFVFQMGLVVSGLSSILNNTPIVALMIPYINNWGKRQGIHPSKFLIPLSYMAITGGMITLIGTSTNLVLNGFLEQNNEPLLGFDDFLIPGLLVSGGGLLFFTTIGGFFLPDKQEPLEQFSENVREYVVETDVRPDSVLIGKTIQEADLRTLRGVYLLEIIRNKTVISPVSPDEVIQSNDHLVFVGNTETIIDLVDSDNGIYASEHSDPGVGSKRELVEAVIPANSDLAGQKVRDTNFRDRFEAGIFAIHRNGERLSGKIGDIRLQSGDLLLLSVGKFFKENIASFRDLYVVSELDVPALGSKFKNGSFFALSIGTLAAGIAGTFSLFTSFLLVLLLMFIYRYIDFTKAKKEIDVDLLLLLVSALALGEALISSGAAEMLGNILIDLTRGSGVLWTLIGLFILTLLLTNFVTNPAAVSIAFPLAYSLSREMDVAGEMYYLTIAFAASCAFITPIGYQTNLMVYGPGGYRFGDFVRVGLPMTVVYAAIFITYLTFKYDLIS
jgi:di/tricarboxylate transporter